MDTGSTEQPASGAAPTNDTTAANPLMSAANKPAVPPPVSAGVADQPEGDDPAWIEKARQVILRSKGDPFTRHDALNKLKMQYLKQRFGKELGDS